MSRGWTWRVTREDLGLRLEGRQLRRNGLEFTLPPFESKIMAALMLRDKGPVSCGELVEFCYDDEPLYADRCVVVYLCQIRRVLRSMGLVLLNIHGRGWELSL